MISALTLNFVFADALAQYANDNSNFYELRLGSVTWLAASVLSPLAVYRGVTGHLVTIEDSTEEAFVKWLAGTGDFWLGLTQKPSSNQWIYSTGATAGLIANYTDWYLGFPSGANPNCVFMNASDNGHWSTTGCAQSLPYIIEYECATGYAFGASGCIGLIAVSVDLFKFDDVLIADYNACTAQSCGGTL